jgi:hypothetical protein
MDFSKTLAYPSVIYSTVGAGGGAAAATFPKSTQTSAGIFITKIIASANAAPGGVITLTLTGPVNAAGSAVTLTLEIPAAAFAPIVIDFGTHPLKCAANTDAVLTLGAVGGATLGAVQLFGYYGPTS